MPAPTSPIWGDCSYTSTSRPRLSNASATERPPMPPPMTTIVSDLAITALRGNAPDPVQRRELDHLGALLGYDNVKFSTSSFGYDPGRFGSGFPKLDFINDQLGKLLWRTDHWLESARRHARAHLR